MAKKAAAKAAPKKPAAKAAPKAKVAALTDESGDASLLAEPMFHLFWEDGEGNTWYVHNEPVFIYDKQNNRLANGTVNYMVDTVEAATAFTQEAVDACLAIFPNYGSGPA